MNLLSNLAAVDISFLQQPPWATFFILFLTLAINLVMSFANKRMMDLDAYRRVMIESAKVRKELMDAMKSGNQRRISRAQNRQQDLTREQQQISMGRMKLTFYFMVPFILIWQFLNRFFGQTIIAYMPFNSPFSGTDLNIGNWYILCSFTINIILSRVFGITFEIDPEDNSE